MRLTGIELCRNRKFVSAAQITQPNSAHTSQLSHFLDPFSGNDSALGRDKWLAIDMNEDSFPAETRGRRGKTMASPRPLFSLRLRVSASVPGVISHASIAGWTRRMVTTVLLGSENKLFSRGDAEGTSGYLRVWIISQQRLFFFPGPETETNGLSSRRSLARLPWTPDCAVLRCSSWRQHSSRETALIRQPVLC